MHLFLLKHYVYIFVLLIELHENTVCLYLGLQRNTFNRMKILRFVNLVLGLQEHLGLIDGKSVKRYKLINIFRNKANKLIKKNRRNLVFFAQKR